jgi:hypothetical protein
VTRQRGPRDPAVMRWTPPAPRPHWSGQKKRGERP